MRLWSSFRHRANSSLQGLAFALAFSYAWLGALPLRESSSFITSVAAEERGRPKVVLDHLEFPERFGARKYEKHLRRQLQKEGRKVDWGASSDSTIQYRYEVTKLSVVVKEKVLTVSCSAVGRLPKGRSAASQLSFSGHPKDHDKLVKHVLDIVARGVMARLAEMERVRRGELSDRRVLEPTGSD